MMIKILSFSLLLATALAGRSCENAGEVSRCWRRWYKVCNGSVYTKLRIPSGFECVEGAGINGGLGVIKSVKVEITNLTKGQHFGGIFFMSGRKDVNPVYTLGEPSSSELETLAEDGSPADLVTAYETNPLVFEASARGDGLTDPGTKYSFHTTISAYHPYLSIVTMLVNTNDAFAGIQWLNATPSLVKMTAAAYDAGTEVNSEDCDDIPGPACGGAAGEGATESGNVYVSEGIHGIDNLEPQDYDWRNPVMFVKIYDDEP